MSLHFDLVINCDLREDTSPAFIDALKCLTDRSFEVEAEPQLLVQWTEKNEVENAWKYFYDRHFLAPDPECEIISHFSRKHRLTIPLENNREVYRYSLQYVGRWLHDDFFYAHHMPLIHWLATIAYESCIGYYTETFEGGFEQLLVINRQLKISPLQY